MQNTFRQACRKDTDYPDTFTPDPGGAGATLPAATPPLFAPVFAPPVPDPPPLPEPVPEELAPLTENPAGNTQINVGDANEVQDETGATQGGRPGYAEPGNETNPEEEGEEADNPIEVRPTLNIHIDESRRSLDLRGFDPAIHGSIQDYAEQQDRLADEQEKEAVYALLVSVVGQIELTPKESHTGCVELPNQQSCINHQDEPVVPDLSGLANLQPNPRPENEITIPVGASDFEIVQHLLENNPYIPTNT